MDLKAFKDFITDCKITEFDASLKHQKKVFIEYQRGGTPNKSGKEIRRNADVSFNGGDIDLYFERKRIAGKKNQVESLTVEVACRIDFHGRKVKENKDLDKRKTWSIKFYFEIKKNTVYPKEIFVRSNSHREDAENHDFAEFVFQLVDKNILQSNEHTQERKSGLKGKLGATGEQIGTKNIMELPKVLIDELSIVLKKYFGRKLSVKKEKKKEKIEVVKTMDISLDS